MIKKFKFGKAFPDQLLKVAFKYGHFHKSKDTQDDWQNQFIPGLKPDFGHTPNVSEWRRLSLAIVLMIFIATLFFRLFHLQIVEGSKNRELADSNRIQIKLIHAPRGVIYDRNGKILAQNEPGFRLVEGSGSKVKVSYISRDQALKMETSNDPNYKNLEVDSIRTYSMGQVGAHILGYVGEINDVELKDPNFKAYKLGDKIGRGGVEEFYEKILRGIDGGEIIEVDAVGKIYRTLNKTEPIPGQNLVVSIDSDLQNLAYQKLEEAIKKIKHKLMGKKEVWISEAKSNIKRYSFIN